MRHYYVYILSNKPKGTLYTGSTSKIIERAWSHKHRVVQSFSSKYNLDKLVYYEIHGLYENAARREKRIKQWPRQWKLNLIESINPSWRDLFDDVCM